ncbi:MAG TPA: glycosyltransferase [Candidatus Limnocylindria bacterium]|nr:glycosyltransferase [Candidatus Limnocylindria bacterium]
MKLLVFAHVPPPLHGQSQMVQYLVEGLRADPSLGIEVIHVDARLSDGLEDVGTARGGKLPRLLRFCAQAIRLRLMHGVTTLYYVPTPPKRTPLYRDWIALALLRPWFRDVVFHWHAVGLGEWLATQARPWERWLSRRLLGGVSLCIVLAEAGRADAERLKPRRTVVVGNGVTDPCPDFATALGPERATRFARRQAEGGEVMVLFMALCTRDKGVFDAVEAIALANGLGAKEPKPLRFRLTVGGTFPTPALEQEFQQLVRDRGVTDSVEHVGFLQGEAKAAALRAADVFLFPTYYANEGQPLGVAEAMAFGLPVVTTRWRAIPEMLPAGSRGLVEPRQPAQAAAALVTMAQTADGKAHRAEFERKFTLTAHLRAIAQAIGSVGR